MKLPVIQKCGDCSRSRIRIADRHVSGALPVWICCHDAVVDGVRPPDQRVVDALNGPPDWCPMRAVPTEAAEAAEMRALMLGMLDDDKPRIRALIRAAKFLVTNGETDPRIVEWSERPIP